MRESLLLGMIFGTTFTMHSSPCPCSLNTSKTRHLCSVDVAQVEYPEIEEGSRPRYRFMSAFEQRVETADKNIM